MRIPNFSVERDPCKTLIHNHVSRSMILYVWNPASQHSRILMVDKEHLRIGFKFEAEVFGVCFRKGNTSLNMETFGIN